MICLKDEYLQVRCTQNQKIYSLKLDEANESDPDRMAIKNPFVNSS